MIRVLVVDDQELVRTGLATMVAGAPDVEVVGEAADGRAAVAEVTRLRPDVVLMDIRMPVLDGLAATREIVAAARDGRPAVLVLTTFDADEQVIDALRAGASGFLLKDVATSTLVDAIRAAHAGDMALSPAITRRLVERHLAVARDGRAPGLDTLTAREVDVLTLVAEGATNTEIAARLHLGESTVKTHVGSLLAKLGARDRVRLVIIGYEAGLVS